MMAIIITIHVIACLLLIGIILVQRGRGSGLVESFSGVESMFGTKTNAFLSRTTTVLSIVFFLTCLGLAFLSAKQSKSLMKDIKPEQTAVQEPLKKENLPSPPEEPKTETPEAPQTE